MDLIQLTDNELATTQEVLRHVPVGSSITDAQHLLEQEGFECSREKDVDGTAYLFRDIHKSVASFVYHSTRCVRHVAFMVYFAKTK